tara:strand:+ start:1258 stop:2307 length:1050 start_codon:yes stop_codon:yes gene_type:complete
MKKFIKKVIYQRFYKPIIEKKINLPKSKFYFKKFGNLNPDKIFYVIQRTPGFGLFSNLSFVLNHIKIAKNFGFIPIIDMENFPSIYNEKKKILNTLNSWEYYFEQISNNTLDEVYKSKNVILTENNFYSKDEDFFANITESKDLVKILRNYIRLKNSKYKLLNHLKKKFIDNKKTLGVHFRGTTYKTAGVVFAATINQMINKINKILEENKYDKIFLVTEDLKNFNSIINYFGDKVMFLNTSLRGNSDLEVWDNYSRNRHRYKLGRDILLETYLLSYCEGYLDIDTNPREIAHALNLNTNQKRYTIDNGHNKSWPIFNHIKYSWYIRNFLPERFGGFLNNSKPGKKKFK